MNHPEQSAQLPVPGLAKVATLLRNTGYLLGAEIARPALGFLLIVYLSRSLGVSGLGTYALILTATYVFEVVATLGLVPIIVREIAVDRSRAAYFLRAGVVFGVLAGVAAWGLIAVGLGYMNYSPEASAGIRLLSWTLPVMVLIQYLQAIFEGLQQMQYRSLLTLVETIGRVGLGVSVAYLGYGVSGVIYAFVFVRLVTFLIAVALVLVKASVPLGGTFEWRSYPGLLGEALPFLSITVVSTLYWHVDILMLSKLGTMEGVGTYSAAFRLIDILKSLSYTYMVALLPMISATFARSRSSFGNECNLSIKYLVLVTLPAACGMSVLAGRVVGLVYGEEFAESAMVLRILIWTICLFPVAMVLARALVASHNQKLDLWCNVAGLAVNVVLNWLLIPRFGPNGAAAATVGSIVFFLLFLWLAVNRTLFRASLWPAFSRPIPAAVGMTALAWWLGDAPLIVVIPLCALAYGGLLLLLRSFSAEETEVLRALFGGRFSRNALSAR